MKKKHLLVHYISTPKVDFGCDYPGIVRIKVTHYSNRIFFPFINMAIYALSEGSLHLFDFSEMTFWDAKDITNAANRYKKYLQLPDMKIIGNSL